MPQFRPILLCLVFLLIAPAAHAGVFGGAEQVVVLNGCRINGQYFKKVQDLLKMGEAWDAQFTETLRYAGVFGSRCVAFNANPTQQGAADLVPAKTFLEQNLAKQKALTPPLTEALQSVYKHLTALQGTNPACENDLKAVIQKFQSNYPDQLLQQKLQNCAPNTP